MVLYEYAPQKNLRKLSGIVMILVCVALLLFLVTSVFPELPYRWVLQLAGFGCIAAIIYLTVKYVTKTFVYAIIKKDDETLDLTVTEVSNGGKSRITVCRISMSGIEKISAIDRYSDTDRIKADKLISRSKQEKRKVFDYAQNLSPRRMLFLMLTECEEPILLKLETDEKFERYLFETLGISAEE